MTDVSLLTERGCDWCERESECVCVCDEETQSSPLVAGQQACERARAKASRVAALDVLWNEAKGKEDRRRRSLLSTATQEKDCFS